MALVFGLLVLAPLLAVGEARAAAQCGEAAWYDAGGITASGEPNRAGALTAAHPNLPFGTKVSVRNLANGKSVVVRINDRGPFAGKRIIDLSRSAAEALGFIHDGVAQVQVSVLGKVNVKLKGACPATAVAATGAGDAHATADAETSPAAPSPAASAGGPDRQAIAKGSMSTRFTSAFQPDSWGEAELRKALEAFIPALRP